jgi:hypothetical protein
MNCYKSKNSLLPYLVTGFVLIENVAFCFHIAENKTCYIIFILNNSVIKLFREHGIIFAEVDISSSDDYICIK